MSNLEIYNNAPQYTRGICRILMYLNYFIILGKYFLALFVGAEINNIKNFSFNEWFFPAHFDDDPNVPGFVQTEALAQTFLMTFLCMDEYKGEIVSALGYNNVKFKRKIVPGDTLEIIATVENQNVFAVIHNTIPFR